MARFGYTLMTEQSSPKDLVRYAIAAEQVGFDFEVSSDHYSPWLVSQGHAPVYVDAGFTDIAWSRWVTRASSSSWPRQPSHCSTSSARSDPKNLRSPPRGISSAADVLADLIATVPA